MNQVSIFQTSIGWVGIESINRAVRRISMGHASASKAAAAIECSTSSTFHPEHASLIEQFERYFSGEAITFDDIEIADEPTTDFRRRVWEACREIPYGETTSYSQLAEDAGSPRAARAVGSAMAANRVPIIIPCHRVVGANNGLGGFSAPTGTKLKERLLKLESKTLLASTGAQ